VEEDVNVIAFQQRWPPGSWDNLTIRRAVRMVNALIKHRREQAAAPAPADFDD
jgi:hypothetical protein